MHLVLFYKVYYNNIMESAIYAGLNPSIFIRKSIVLRINMDVFSSPIFWKQSS